MISSLKRRTVGVVQRKTYRSGRFTAVPRDDSPFDLAEATELLRSSTIDLDVCVESVEADAVVGAEGLRGATGMELTDRAGFGFRGAGPEGGSREERVVEDCTAEG